MRPVYRLVRQRMAAPAPAVWENTGMTPEAERAKARLEACRFWTEQSRALHRLEQRSQGGGEDLRERRRLAERSMKQAAVGRKPSAAGLVSPFGNWRCWNGDILPRCPGMR